MQHPSSGQTLRWLLAGLLLLAMGCTQPPSEQALPTGDVRFVSSMLQASCW